jgi:hypothetical protein
MCDSRQRSNVVQSLVDHPSELLRSDAFGVEPGNQLSEEREKHWRCRLQSLEEWICLLLIKNQELRMSLQNAGINHRFGEFDQ